MLKTFKYKLDPNRAQRLALEKTLDICREVWNLALEQRKIEGAA
jgi:putative transposase